MNDETITIPKLEYEELKFKLCVAESDIKMTQTTKKVILKKKYDL